MAVPGGESEPGPKRHSLHLGLLELKERAQQARKAQGALYGQAVLESAVRRTERAGTGTFAGQRISSWVPAADRGREAQVPQDIEVLMAVVAVWSSWAGAQSLVEDGRLNARWLRAERPRWERLLEEARAERDAARTAVDGTDDQERLQEVELAASVAAYRQRVQQVHRRLDLDVLGASGSAGEQPEIEVRQVFMPQSCRPHVVKVPGEVRRLLMAAGELAEADLPPGLEADAARDLRKDYHGQPARPVLEVLAGEGGRRMVVLGDPGAGKSTLVKFAALALAGAPEEVPAELAGLSGLVPVVVELRQYAQAQWRERTIEDFLEHVEQQDRMCLPRTDLERLLALGRAVVFFDGLDEVFDPQVRAQTARRITAFAAAHPGVRVVVTSREYGYRAGEFTAAGFTQVMLQDLERGQVERFIRLWYAAAHPQRPSLAAQLSERLLGAVRGVRAVAELAGNPLLLTVVASMGLGKTIPRERREVYAHAVEVLIEQWDKDAKFLHPHAHVTGEAAQALEWLDVDRRLKVLQRIARRMQEGAGRPAGTFIQHSELTAIISAYLTEQNVSRTASDIAAGHVVARLRDRNFLLAHYGGGIYGFVHRTFLEYLAASDLLERSREEEWTRDETVAILAERAQDPAWHEVLLLTAGSLPQRGVAALIANLLHQHQRRRKSDGWSVPMLVLAIRVLAEVKEIGASPTPRTKDRHLSVAAQSDAVIDALTITLRWIPYPSIHEALPALGTFDRFWSGRERYLRWYHAHGTQSGSSTAGSVAAALSWDWDGAHQHTRIPWDPFLRTAALRVLGERWPERDDSRRAVLAATTDADPQVRRTALRLLGRYWPERDDSQHAVLAAVEDTDTDTDAIVRRTALDTLGEYWPERDDSHAAVLAATQDTHPDLRRTALNLLGEYWRNRSESHRAVLAATTDTHPEVRHTALYTLGDCWPERDDSHTAVLTATQDTDPNLRAIALDALGHYWPEGHGSHGLVLAATTDTHPEVRHTALYALGEYWPGHDDSHTAVLTATQDTQAGVRAIAIDALGRHWRERDDSHRLVLAATTDTHPEVRRSAIQVLGDCWPERDASHRAAVAATKDTDAHVRAGALDSLGQYWPESDHSHHAAVAATRDTDTQVRRTALRLLGRCWPERDDSHGLVLAATQDTHPDIRDSALDILGQYWPEREDSRQAALAATQDTHPRIRRTALDLLGEYWPEREDSRHAFLAATADSDTEVRRTALQVLAVRFPALAWPVVCGHTDEEQPPDVRMCVIKLLTLLWPDAPDTLPLIRAMERHDDEDIRRTAGEALSFLGTQ